MSDVSFDQVIRSRRSTRAYREGAVPEATLSELVELATLAPTALGLQPWRFSVITNRDVLTRVGEEVRQTCLAMVGQVPGLERARPMLENEGYDIFYGAPALVVIQGPRGNHVGFMDCLLATENLVLAAHARGLGTCFMGFLLLARESQEIRRALAVEDGYEIVAPIIVGASDAIPQTPPEREPARIAWVR
jgi:nitroreductase